MFSFSLVVDRGSALALRVGALLGLALVLWLIAPTTVGAEDSLEADKATSTAPVVIDGVVLFRVRGAEAFPAERRARVVADRILAVARNRVLDPETILIKKSDIGPVLTIEGGPETLITIIGADARREGLGQLELATLYRTKIITAIADYRNLRKPGRLLRSTGRALVRTALFVLLVVCIRWLFRRLDHGIGSRTERAVKRLQIQSFTLLSPDRTWLMLRGLLRVLRGGLIVVLLYIYVNSVLALFPWTQAFARRMFDLVVSPLVTIGQGILASIPDLFFLLVLVFVTRMVLRLIKLFFLEIGRGAVRFENFDQEWAMPTYRLIRVLVVAFALVVGFPYIPGSSSGAFKGVSLFVGVLFSLGSSSVIGNIIAGYTMTYRRAFRDGDRIRVGDVVGVVTATRLLVTHVRTPKNEDVVIPNSLILSENVINYSTHAKSNGLVLHTTVGIGYEVPWRQVEAMLLEAAERTDGLSRNPSPFVLQTALGDFAVTYELNAYSEEMLEIPQRYSRLHKNILDVFNEYGVAIMTPSYVADPPEPKLVLPENRYTVPAQRPDGGD